MSNQSKPICRCGSSGEVLSCSLRHQCRQPEEPKNKDSEMILLNKKEILHILDIAQAELTSNYKKLGYLSSNVLRSVNTMYDFVKSQP
jgi:hypothetical protein